MDHKPYYQFEITLSQQRYDCKPDSVDYSQMKWRQTEILLSDFINRIKSGYSYCHIYHGSRRIKSKFLYTHVVSIDVDDTDVELLSFISESTLKPTFAYETFSNGKDGKYSYRLVFVFKERLNSKAFVEMYEKLCRMTNLTNTKDHCGKVLTQLMNGTHKDAYVYRSDIIYSAITDLPIGVMQEDKIVDETSLFTKGISTSKPQYNSSILYNNINISSINQKQYKPKDQFWKELLHNFQEPIDMLMKDRKTFLDFYHQIFKVVRWSKLTYNDSGYCVIPEDHLSLFVRYKKSKGECVVNRFRDGEKRRNRLFIDGYLIRKIKPEINFLELLYNLVHRV